VLYAACSTLLIGEGLDQGTAKGGAGVCVPPFSANAVPRLTMMTDKSFELVQHRGMAAQKATRLRHLLPDVEANERALRLRQDELESHLVAVAAANWHEAAEKARYLLNLFSATPAAQDPRRKKLIAAVFPDFERLTRQS
jgi:hypothetical protein